MTLMNDLAYLGAALGFSAIEIYNAYIEKIKSIMIVRHPDIKRRRNSGESYSLDKRRNSVSGGFLGTYSIKSIAKKLDRTVNAIKLKANRIGLSDARLHFNGLTVLQLADVLQVSYKTIESWYERFAFPIRLKLFAKAQK